MRESVLKTRGIGVLSIVCVLAITSACGMQSGLTNVKNDTSHLRAQLQVLREEVALQEDMDSLLVRIDRMEVLLRDQVNELYKMRGDLGQRIDGLESQLQVLDTRISESDRQFSALVRKLEGLQFQLTAAERPDTTASAESAQSVVPGDLYDLALGDYQRGNYDVAVRQFTQYLQYFPDSALADDAQYYIGDCYYTQSLYTQALDAYETVLSTYPDSNKVPTTLLKIGFVKLARKEQSEARTYLERVIGDFPNSEEAQLARMRLDLLSDE